MRLEQLKEELKAAEQLKYNGLTVSDRFEGFKLVRDLTKEIEKELKESI